MKRLLFDLRGNSGGYLEQAAAIADQFITTQDTLVYTVGKIKESNQVFKDITYDIHLVSLARNLRILGNWINLYRSGKPKYLKKYPLFKPSI